MLTKLFTAYHLKVRPADLAVFIKDDDLPVIQLPGKTKPIEKIMPYSLYKWEHDLSKGIFPSFQEWMAQIDYEQTQFNNMPKPKKKTPTPTA